MKHKVKMNRQELIEYLNFKRRGSVVPHKNKILFRKRKHKLNIV